MKKILNFKNLVHIIKTQGHLMTESLFVKIIRCYMRENNFFEGMDLMFKQDFLAVADSLTLWAIVAVIPIIYFFWALAVKKMKGYTAGLTTLLISLILAVFAFKVPVSAAVMSATQGAVYGLLPIGWIIVTSVFLYNMTVKTGQFDII